jgi:two-component system, NarL family, sensor histidine kinase BarA
MNKRRPKVLLVEDNDTLAMIASIHLSRFELDFDRARDGTDAVEAVRNTDYDLILMDVRMATMNGFEATVQIRNLEKLSGQHANIVGVTASDSKADCMNAGMDEFAQKPADYADIIEHYLPNCDRKTA